MDATSLDVPAKRGNQTYHKQWLFSIIISFVTNLENHWRTISQISGATIRTARKLYVHTAFLRKSTRD
ncbi:hypothetical protein SAMN04489801_5928 [Pseudomonas mandelii]|uniref:Transposase n=1 Tax=Pseudomonas mandelii TaxID=75612 RepID=A0ABY0W182_9PSED|nr:hypothetical protein SAMN04489801_5928 [Pseudomonas mandelii]